MRLMILAFCLAAPAAAQPPLAQPGAAPSEAAGPWDPPGRLAAQREAMKALAFLDGAWRGPIQSGPGGGGLIQTERVGTLLDGTVRVIEGRAYDASGRTAFNALGIVSYDPVKRTYSLHSYAMGYAGDFPIEVRPDGFGWTQPAGPGSSIRYTATVANGEWHEVGERIAGSAAPVKAFEMRLKRIGASDWPGSGAVGPR